MSSDSLNFYPYYERLLRERQKTKTVRLGDQTSKYPKGVRLRLTCGWDSANAITVGHVRIADAYSTSIASLTNSDLEGKSPDLLTVAALPYVLSAMYRKVVIETNLVTIVRWTYAD
jgi:hypothetical protein